MTEAGPVPMRIDSIGLRGYEPVIRSALPLSLSTADGMDGALVAVDGGDRGWGGHVARVVGDGALGVLVEAPRRLDQNEAEALTDAAARVPVLLRRRYLSNPVFHSPRDAWPRAEDALSLVTDQFIASPADVDQALFDHLSVVREVVGEVESVDAAEIRSSGYSVTGTLEGGTPLVIGGIVSATEPARVRMRLLRPPRRLVAEIFTDETSRPAMVTITDGDGDRLLPTSYESSHRAAWRRLAAAARDSVLLPDVRSYLADLTLLARVRGDLR